MQFSPSLNPARPVYLSNPVNRSHPLHFGRVAWWLALPGLDGGLQFYDLMDRGLHGKLTSMGNANNGWRSATRPGGYGHILFDGTAGIVATPGIVGPQNSSTYAMWLNWTTGTVPLSQYTASAPAGCYTQVITTGNTIGFRISNTISGPFIGRTASPFNTRVWYRYLATWDGGTTSAAIKIYLNGIRLDNTNDVSGTFTVPDPNSIPLWLGAQDYGGYNAGFQGAIDDVSIWNRPLSALEAQADYDLSRRGYPGVLNRY